jgi:carbamoyltransferase
MSKKDSYILGVNAYDHDTSACLLRNGEIAFAISKERITRKKHDRGFFREAVDYCLNAEGIGLDDVDLVVRNSYVLPVEDMETRMLSMYVPEAMDLEERAESMAHPLFLPHSNKVMTVSHHLAHAYSGFAVCPFEEGVVMVVDGVGSYAGDITEPGQLTENVDPLARESESYYRFSGSTLETLKKVWLHPTRGFLSDEFIFMPGLGALYSRVSSYIFADWNKCGEVMGLAPYGRPGAFKPLLRVENGELRFTAWDRDLAQPWMMNRDSDWEKSAYMQHWEDLAWRMQDDAETVLLERARWLRETTGAKNLCLAGGVALNCVANGRIAREAGFENVWIQPAAGDDGIAIGCAYYGQLAVQKKPRSYVMHHAFTGVPYTDEKINAATSTTSVRLQARSWRSDDVFAETAKLLSEGNVFGWFQGRSEFGPRALGNRSLIADPRTAAMKEKVNKRVKHRQAFRPFAPVVLAERANDVFECDGRDSPYMLLAERVRPEWRDKIPAVTHVDGTARVQTIRLDQNEPLYRLLQAFDKLTGVPVLMNTSFNVKGEPIVETPEDAINCFLSTGVDYLVLHDVLMTKKATHKVVAPVLKTYDEIASLVRTTLSMEMSRGGG